MKKLCLVLTVVLLSNVASADWKKSVSDGLSDAIQLGKDAYTDVKDNITGENKESEFINVDSLLTFEPNVDFSVTKVSKLENNQYEINVGLKNLAVKPVRLLNVYKDDREVMLLDKEGFAYPLSVNLVNGIDEKQIIIPIDAGIRAKWIFNNVEAMPATIRVFGKNYPLE